MSVVFDPETMESVTLEGLQKWLKHEYEHLGWVALNLSKGYPEKAYAYVISLKRLQNAIIERQEIDTRCQQTIRDLEVLSYKLSQLIKFANILGINIELKTKICNQNGGGFLDNIIQIHQQMFKHQLNNNFNPETMESATLSGLQCWLKYEYEKLACTAFSTSKGHVEKGYAYAIALNRLRKAIIERCEIQTNCEQIIRDLDVLLFKIDHLIKFANKLGITTELKSQICEQNSENIEYISMSIDIFDPETMENITLEGLQCCLKCKYEQLGWIAFGLKKGHVERAYSYIISLIRLRKAIRERIELKPQCPHVIRDLQILMYKINELFELAETLGINIQLKEQVCNNEINIKELKDKNKYVHKKMSKNTLNKLLHQLIL